MCGSAPALGGIGSVLVERERRASRIGKPSRFMSGEEWCELHFDNCRVPAEKVLLGPGGFKKQIAGFNVERIGNAARSLAFGRYAFERRASTCATREQFGRPLCEFQGLQWKFADMELKLEAAQLLLYRAAANADRGLPSRRGDLARQGGVQSGRLRGRERGGAGDGRDRLQPGLLVEYCLRRCRGWMIAGGSVEILKNRIAEHVFDRRFDQRGRATGRAAE